MVELLDNWQKKIFKIVLNLYEFVLTFVERGCIMKTRKFKIYGSLFVAVIIVSMISFAVSAVNAGVAVSNSQLATIYGGAETCQMSDTCYYSGGSASCPDGPSGCTYEGALCKTTSCSSADGQCVGFGSSCTLNPTFCCMTAYWTCQTVASECNCTYVGTANVGGGNDC